MKVDGLKNKKEDRRLKKVWEEGDKKYTCLHLQTNVNLNIGTCFPSRSSFSSTLNTFLVFCASVPLPLFNFMDFNKQNKTRVFGLGNQSVRVRKRSQVRLPLVFLLLINNKRQECSVPESSQIHLPPIFLLLINNTRQECWISEDVSNSFPSRLSVIHVH